MADVFISYHTDSALSIVVQIAHALEQAGVSCWYAPRDVKGIFARSIIQAIDNCKIFLLVLNQEANTSEHVLNEVNSAFNRFRNHENIQFLPFRIGNFQLSPDMRYYLGRMNIVNGGTADAPRIAELVQHTARLLEREPIRKARTPPVIVPKRRIYRPTIAAGFLHTVAVRLNGSVVAAGLNNEGQCNVQNWYNIVSVAAGEKHTAGLLSDGSVVATGQNNFGQCDVQGWKNIIALATGGYHTVGLRSDGSVVAVGMNSRSQCNIQSWRNITAISAGRHHTIGLLTDGSLIATGYNHEKQCDVKTYRNIVASDAGEAHTIMLHSNGLVSAAGSNEFGQCNVKNWHDIIMLAAGTYHTVGLRSDGSVIATGAWKDYGQDKVQNWRGIIAIAAGLHHTIGLLSDHSVTVTGLNNQGQCNVSNWHDIRLPEWYGY